MELVKDLNLEDVKKALTDMEIPYIEGDIPKHLTELITSFGYTAIPVMADLTNNEDVDAELGVVVRNKDLDVDNGVYIFTVLHSGQAGFIVVEPGTISRTPLIRKVTGDITNAITGIDLPPLMPFDAVEIVSHVLVNTFMRNMIESCRIPKEHEQAFLRLYMPKFLADVGMYFVGATTDDGKPMIYEEIVNMEPMIIWRSIQKGASINESDATGGAGDGTEDIKAEEIGKETETGEEEAGIREEADTGEKTEETSKTEAGTEKETPLS